MKANKLVIATAVLSFITAPLFAQESGDSQRQEKSKMEKKETGTDLRGWSVGLRGLFLYDLRSTVYDTDLSPDPYGLNGDKVSANFGAELLIERQFTPFFGVQALFRYGGLSGATETEYYKNTFWSGRIGAIFLWNNLDPNNVGSRWNIYNTVGGMIGSFDAERFLSADDSPNGTLSEYYGGLYGGAGLQYQLATSWRIDFEVDYNIVRTDGFDGFDNNTAWDPYLSVGLGVTYTLGSKEKPAMYATNYYEKPYYDIASQKARMTELEEKMEELEEKNAKELEEMKEGLKTAGENNGRQDETLDQLKKRVEKLEKEETQMATSTSYKAVVFFAFDSATLTREAKQNLVEMLSGEQGPFTLVGFADKIGPDPYNAKLKQRRAEAVKRFMTDQMGYAADKISIETAVAPVDAQEEFLKRRVEVR